MTKPWQITGGVVVEENATTRDERGRSVVQRRPLAGIPVQITARDNEDEPFEVWGITWTDHDGRDSSALNEVQFAELVAAEMRAILWKDVVSAVRKAG